jgi:AAA domain (Cdc48 subfamily)
MPKESDGNLIIQNPWGKAGPLETLEQVADLTGKFMSAPVVRSPDGLSFHILQEKRKITPGIQEVYGSITPENKLQVLVQLVKFRDGIRVGDNFIDGLLEIFKEFQLADPPRPCDPGHREIWFQFHGEATPLGPSRENAFLKKMENLNDAARRLQAHIPVPLSDLSLDKIYKEHSEYLNPVYPCGVEAINGYSKIIEWARENHDFVAGQCSIAMVSPYPILVEFGLAIMAKVFIEKGSSLGRLIKTQLTPQSLLNAAREAPGTIVVSAEKLTIGSNLYSISSEARAMFSSLDAMGKAILFTGTYEELQIVIAGGQGGRSDPLEPVVRRIPDIPMKILLQFTVQSEGRRHGGLSRTDEQKLVKKITDVLAKDSTAIQYRLLPKLVAWAFIDQSRGLADASVSLTTFRDRLMKPTETLSGLGHRPKPSRAPHVQEHFLKVLDDPGLLEFLKANILGQDRVLKQLNTRLLDKVSTGKLYEPLCYLAEGTTGTGKSESARLLAKALGIPFKSIDTASMADHYSANAKLRGSGRGIVGSYESGVLEKAAKDHLGVVVEVRDLDHAPTHIRKNLAADFLQILEEGEAETGTGATFSCANLIFAFTINLPEGRDEKLRRGFGFGAEPSQAEVQSRAIKEVKALFSPAFMGRVGEPILFEDLTHETLATVAEKAVVTAIQTVARRYGVPIGEVALEDGLGMAMVASSHLANAMLGARSFVHLGRSLGGKAFREFLRSGANPNGKNMTVSWKPQGDLAIKID